MRDEERLREALVGIFAELGGSVRIFPGAENLVRPRAPGDDEAPYVVEVEGVPNLLHELGHALLVGRLERDHGTDFSRIPFDLETTDGRRLLAEELACCALSCRWHPGSLRQAHDWFAEQVGIQAVFYGMEREPAAFLERVDRWLDANQSLLPSTLQRAEQALIERLAGGSSATPPPRPNHPLDFAAWWTAHRRPGSSPPR